MQLEKQILEGNFIVTLVEGDIIPAHLIKSTDKGVLVEGAEISVTLDPISIDEIIQLDREGNLEKIKETGYCKAIAGLLEIEKLAEKFYEETGAKELRLVIFGSGSLSLSILPNRISHDIDGSARNSNFAS